MDRASIYCYGYYSVLLGVEVDSGVFGSLENSSMSFAVLSVWTTLTRCWGDWSASSNYLGRWKAHGGA